MKILIVFAVALVLAGCQCGPGISCKSDSACEPWGRCGVNGFCITRVVNGDGGMPRAVVPTTQVDLELVGCGRMKSQKITITNAGSGTLTFNATLINGTTFSVSPAMGELFAEQTAELTVTGTVPDTALVNTEAAGVLTLNINEEGRAKIDIPLKLKSSGVTLTLTPNIVNFAPSPVGDAPQVVPVALKNTGNLAASITLTQPTDDQFSITWAAIDAGPSLTLAPGASVAGLEASFRAKRIAPATTLALISIVEPVCGGSAGGIPLGGRGQSGVIELSDTELLFGAAGRVDCGSTAMPKTFTIRNSGNASFSWTGTLAKGGTSPFTVFPNNGQIFGNSDAGVTLTVTPSQIPATASTAGDGFGDRFVITTSIFGDPGRSVDLRQTANGAVLSFSSPTVDFGLVSIGDTASAAVSLINNGNAAASVSFSSNNPKFALTPVGPLPSDAGTTTSLMATFKPDASVSETGDVALRVSDGGVLCAPLPAALAMNGAGSTGSVTFTPVLLDFGSVNCGAAGVAQTVTFKNSGNQNYNITGLWIGDGGSQALYTASMNPVTGLVARDGGTLVITVAPKQLPLTSAVTPNLFGDTLAVMTDVAGDPLHLIALKMTARGAIFGISTSLIQFGPVAVGSMATSQFTINNSGNAPGNISFTPGQPSVFSLPRDAGIAGASSFVATAVFSPQAIQDYLDAPTITTPGSTVLCQPLPFTSMDLRGKGTGGNALTVSPPSLTFGSGGFVPCGTSGSPMTVLVTNVSAYPVVLTLRVGGADGGSPYTVMGPATLGPGDAGTVTVSPKQIPSTSSTAPDFYADTLSIQAVGFPVNETQLVALHQTAQGAKLSFFPTSLNFTGGLGATPTANFTLNNAGNISSPYTLTIGGLNPGAFSVTPTSGIVDPAMGVTETVRFTGELLSPKRLANISVSVSAPICAPLPAPVQLSAN